MLYGNHNIYLREENYVKNHHYRYYNEYKEMYENLFPHMEVLEALVLKHQHTEQELFIVHGHQGDLFNDQLWPLTMLSMKYFWRYLHAFGIKSPVSPIKNVFRRHKIETNYIKWIATAKRMLICGHTHRFKYPRQGELPYFNTGCCVYPTTITAIELENDEISLIRWKLLPNEDGVLHVERMVLMGPKPISYFDIRDVAEHKISSLMQESVDDIRRDGHSAETRT